MSYRYDDEYGIRFGRMELDEGRFHEPGRRPYSTNFGYGGRDFDRAAEERERQMRRERESYSGRGRGEDWARQVPEHSHRQGQYEDYGWEPGESVLPQFRDPSVHRMPYERDWTVPGPHTGRGPKNYQRSDERIMEDANERLWQHGQIDASNIEVSAKNGEVTLTGNVDSRRMKRLAEDIIEDIPGVKDVHNQLRVGQEEQARSTTAR